MFATRLNEILQWIDSECSGLKPEDMRDGFRARIVELTRDFLAFPHCENFALMPNASSSSFSSCAAAAPPPAAKPPKPVRPPSSKRARHAPKDQAVPVPSLVLADDD